VPDVLALSEQIRFEYTSETVCTDQWVPDKIRTEFQTKGPATGNSPTAVSVELETR